MSISRALFGEVNGTLLQYFCLENPMDRGAWSPAVHGVVKSRTWLSDFTFTFYFPALEKEMATHSSVLAWRIPGMGEPGGLPSIGSHRAKHDWSDLAAAAAELYYQNTYTLLKFLLTLWNCINCSIYSALLNEVFIFPNIRILCLKMFIFSTIR